MNLNNSVASGKETKNLMRLVEQLHRQSEQIDDELDLIKNDYFEKRELLQKRIRSQAESIAALRITSNHMNNSGGIQENDLNILQTEVSQLNETVKTVQQTINHLENEIKETYQLINSVPSNNPEIIEIAKRQITRTIQTQTFEAQEDLEEAHNYLESLQNEIILAESLVKGISRENELFKTRINGAKTNLAKIQKQNTYLSNNIEETRGKISLNDLKIALKKNLKESKADLQRIKKEYKQKFTELDLIINDTNRELFERRNIIETLNGKITELTLTALNIKEEGNKEISRIKQRYYEEIQDIQQRSQKQCDLALKKQRNSILSNFENL